MRLCIDYRMLNKVNCFLFHAFPKIQMFYVSQHLGYSSPQNPRLFDDKFTRSVSDISRAIFLYKDIASELEVTEGFGDTELQQKVQARDQELDVLT